jgi:tRNA A-37 threonylcarbamoyl transferase component Bud32
MNKEAALAILRLQGNENSASVARAYGEQLASVQELLVAAESDVERNAHGARLAELSQAYELITGTGRYASPNEGATLMRSGTALSPASSSPMLVHMEPGAVIADRIEIGGLLGEGGMGCVYAARDRLKSEDVAIKVLREDLRFSREAKDRFLAEAKVSCSLSHPNIVRVHDVGTSGDAYYLSMERLQGQTLRQKMDQYRKKNRVFRLAEVTDIARQLIDALRYAHRYIIHRDIKPENIWLAEDGTVKLMDFGIARVYSNSQMTQTGMMLGTAYYMSPEQRAGSKKLDWRTDQYALGVVLYELFTGTLPTGAVQPIVRRDLPKRYADALMRAMSPSPDKRFESFDEMLEEILAPRPKRFRLARVVLLSTALTAAFVTANDRGWIMKLSAATTALKSELAAMSERMSGGVPVAAPSAAPEPAPAELKPAELAPALLEPAALESAAQEPIALESVATEPVAPEQTEASATAQSEASIDEASPIDAMNAADPAISPDQECHDEAGESEHLCLDELQDCRPPCESRVKDAL